jgi:hypothetical protein
MLQQPDESQWWLDDEMWLDLFGWLFLEEPSKADDAAKLWYRLLVEIRSGPEGVTRARSCLENALRLTFPYTETYHLCRTLFQISLSDDFPANREPMELLAEAMERNKAGLVAQAKVRRKRRTQLLDESAEFQPLGTNGNSGLGPDPHVRGRDPID